MDLQGYFSFVLSDIFLNVWINTERKNVIGTNSQRILFKYFWDKSQLIFDFLKVKTFMKFSNETRSKKIVDRYPISTYCLMLYSLRILNQPGSITYFPALQHGGTVKLSVSVHESEEIINFENKSSDHLFCFLNQITTNQKNTKKISQNHERTKILFRRT